MPKKKEQFDEFYDANPQIADLFLRFTKELIVVWTFGPAKIRPYVILHRVRWELMQNGEDLDLVNRLKTLYGNRYAMELIAKDGSYRKFFDLTVT